MAVILMGNWGPISALPHIDVGGEIENPSGFDTIQGDVSFNVLSRRPAMSMTPQPIPEIPVETARVVRAVFPKGNMYIHLRDTLGTIDQDDLFTDLYPERGQPAYAPWRLALVTIFGLHGEPD
jgi:hypothetical protein